MRGGHGERGAALLTVLILVGVMGAIAVTVFDRLRLATMLSGNAGGIDEARAFGLVGETLVTTRIDDLVAASPAKTTLAGNWQGRPMRLPLPGGTATARVVDGGNCFNVNSLVSGAPPDSLVSNPVAIEQFSVLLALVGVQPSQARRIAASAADWIDTDEDPNRDGAEDPIYARAVKPYRTGNTVMAETSELRAVSGVTPETYARIQPWLCALPITEMSPINVNTLTSAQAPLLAMLLGDTAPMETARRALAERPVAGWPRAAEFWNTPVLRDRAGSFPGDAERQVQVQTKWFAIDMIVDVGDSELRQTGLVDARQPPARLVTRRWTADQ